MKNSDWTIIKTVIDEILDQPVQQHEELLAQSVSRYPSLKEEIISHYQDITASNDFWEHAMLTNNALISEAIELTNIQNVPVIEYKKGQRIGAYILDERIGKGGMGLVFKAKRADGQFERTVAIKLMALSIQFEEVRARFQREQQILASLNHTNIAQLYDAGVTALGNPFLVMEHVEGVDINEYIANHDLKTEEIVQLFVEICKAVEYAHRNLIVHRDLKPSNILVSEDGELKVLDFGIAKLLDESMDKLIW